jgi:tight adherence protein C
MILLITLTSASAILLFAYWVSSGITERADVRNSLRQLDGYQIQGVRDQEMLQPVSERVLTPVVQNLVGFVNSKTPVGYAETVRQKLVFAGNPPNLDVDRILVCKLLGALSGALWLPLVFFGLGLSGWMGWALAGALWIGSFQGPDIILGRKIEDRRHAIAVQLPDILDLLTISVEAGLGFEQALERTTAAVPGVLSDEFRRMLQETRIGASRADALRALEARTDVPELRAFILAMLQADTFGVSIARILRMQAVDMRQRRRLKAQELAQKAPVKMLFPLILCIFPGVFVIVLYPAFTKIAGVL